MAGTQHTVDQLILWCKANVPNDFVMPVGENKAPRYRHANAKWSWHLLDKHMRRHGSTTTDVGILLQDMCVIDIDCMSIDIELRARFPILDETMCEKTRKGVHYFFMRSKKADLEGFYDSISPRIPKVDFKTVCSNGTSGFVVVAPSKNKTWIRSFEDVDHVPEIPDDLLEAVAKGIHSVVSKGVNFSETGEYTYIESSPTLNKLAYTHMFEELDEMTIPMGTKAEFETLLDVLDGNELKLVHIVDKRGHVDRLCILADFLGVKVSDYSTFKSKWYERVRLYECHPKMALALEDPDLVVLNQDIVARTTVDMITFGEAEVFRVDRPDFFSDPLAPLDGVASEIPSVVLALMRTFPGEVVIAGGFVTGCLVKALDTGNDVDIFIAGTVDRATDIVQHFLIETEGSAKTYRTGNAVTFYVQDEDLPIQIVLKLHNSVQQILSGFDIEPSKAALYCDVDGKVVAAVSRSWLESVKTFSCPVLSTTWSSSSTYRYIKYAAKGFQPYIPGLRRDSEAVREITAETRLDARENFIDALKSCTGIDELVKAEHYHRGENVMGPDAALTRTTIACMTPLFRGIRRSDYAANRTRSALERISTWCLHLVGWRSRVQKGVFVQLSAENAEDVLFWKPAVGSRVHNCFYRADANLDGLTTQ